MYNKIITSRCLPLSFSDLNYKVHLKCTSSAGVRLSAHTAAIYRPNGKTTINFVFTQDTGISVRKRVIKILRDICLEQPDFHKITEMCVKMIRRVNDEEGIKVCFYVL